MVFTPTHAWVAPTQRESDCGDKLAEIAPSFTFDDARRLNPRDDAAFGVLGGDPDVDPAKIGQRLRPSDVVVELSPVGPVVVAFVFHGEFDVLPTHVEDGHELAVFVVDRDLGLRVGKPARISSSRSQVSRGDSAPASTRLQCAARTPDPARPL